MGSLPSKTFLMGEYGVLRGGSALILAHGPRFELKQERGASLGSEIHLESPAGRFLSWIQTQFNSKKRSPKDSQILGAGDSWAWVDPHQGRGGFGASTAQFGLIYAALAPKLGLNLRWESIWQVYRELLTGAESIAPSGADLIAQWRGGVTGLRAIKGGSVPWRAEDVYPLLNPSLFMIFSTGTKVSTHLHLAESTRWLGRVDELKEPLEACLEETFDAIRRGEWGLLGSKLTEYGLLLNSIGLESPEVSRDREALLRLRGVLGVKGTGALQADARIVAVDPTLRDVERSRLRLEIESLGLRCVLDGIDSQMGIIL